MTTTEFIDGEAGKIAVHHLETNTGDKPTLLVCHATGFLGRVYRALATELRDAFNVVAFDFRGHGDSDAPDDATGFAWTGLTNDLLRVVDHLALPQLHGFGHSMGGAALLEAERQRPGTFLSAMVFEPIVPPGSFKEGSSPIVNAARGRLRSFPSSAEALQRYASKPPLGLFRADVLHDYVTHGFADLGDEITLKCTPESEASTFSHAGSIHLGLLKEIELEVTVAVSGDGGLPAQLADAVAEHLPNGSLQTFSMLTHFGPLQDPVTVASALRDSIL